MQPSEMIARMSRDKKLDAFHADNKAHLFKEFLWTILHEAELDLLKDLKSRLKEQDVILAKDTRATNAPNDFLSPKEIRYKTSDDDVLFEGYSCIVVNSEDLP